MKSYDSLDDAYNDLFDRLSIVARRHIFNRDYAVDAVHDAFVKAAEYLAKHPNKKVSGFLLARELMRSCRRINRFSNEVAADFTGFTIDENNA